MRHICPQCGETFTGRRDAKFCSSTCRSRHHRRLDRIDKRFDRARESVLEVARRAWRRDGMDDSNTVVLKQLHRVISTTLHRLEV